MKTPSTLSAPKSACPHCEGEGFWYGTAPHSHDMTKTGSIIGSTVIKPKEEWPSNFNPDPDNSSGGTWTCKKCNGTGKNPLNKATEIEKLSTSKFYQERSWQGMGWVSLSIALWKTLWKFRNQRTWVYCSRCGIDLCSSESHKFSRLSSEYNSMHEFYKCSRCGEESEWHFDTPVPILISTPLLK